MLTTEHIQESLSRAYARAIAARAGIETTLYEYDYGFDGRFNRVVVRGRRRVISGIALDFQIKATVRWIERGGKIVYDLRSKNYNDLVLRNDGDSLPAVLLLFCMPEDQGQWLVQDVDQLILRKCCYWDCVRGPRSVNHASVRVEIPSNQTLSVESLASLLERSRAGTL